jgi:hypothetical protein
MLHRALLVDDGRGVGEPLNETEFISAYVNCEWSKACGVHSGPGVVVRKSLSLLVEAPSLSSWRRRAHDIYASPLVLFTPGELSGAAVDAWSSKSRAPLVNASALPNDIELVSLELLTPQPSAAAQVSIFLRLGHRGHCGDYASCRAMAATVDLQELLGPRRILSSERRLITDQGLFQVAPDSQFGAVPQELLRPAGTFVFPVATLMPIEIHAYRVTVSLA